jgi:hypothetical protein
MSDSFAPVIIIEGFLGLGVVLWFYVSHQREMKRIRQEKAAKAKAETHVGAAPMASATVGSNRDPKTPPEDV